MTEVACPSCGETEKIRGDRKPDSIRITCGVCTFAWTRNLKMTCYHCGSDQLRYTPIPLWSKGRGTMRTPSGKRDSWSCNDCGEPDVTRKP